MSKKVTLKDLFKVNVDHSSIATFVKAKRCELVNLRHLDSEQQDDEAVAVEQLV